MRLFETSHITLRTRLVVLKALECPAHAHTHTYIHSHTNTYSTQPYMNIHTKTILPRIIKSRPLCPPSPSARAPPRSLRMPSVHHTTNIFKPGVPSHNAGHSHDESSTFKCASENFPGRTLWSIGGIAAVVDTAHNPMQVFRGSGGRTKKWSKLYTHKLHD